MKYFPTLVSLEEFLDECRPALRLECWTILDDKKTDKMVHHLINTLFFVVGIVDLNEAYVSLESTNSGRDCQDVPASVVGTFDNDYFGHYQSQSSFQRSDE
mgnify:CR=1 FL=1